MSDRFCETLEDVYTRGNDEWTESLKLLDELLVYYYCYSDTFNKAVRAEINRRLKEVRKIKIVTTEETYTHKEESLEYPE